MGGRVLGPIFSLYVPAIKRDPSLAPKPPSQAFLAVQELAHKLRKVGISSATPGVSYMEERRVLLQERWDTYKERVLRLKARDHLSSQAKRLALLRQFCSRRLTRTLERALLDEKLDAVLIALELGAPTSWLTRRGDTPLTLAVRMKAVKYLGPLVRLGVSVNAADALGATPLVIAVQQRSLGLVRRLLELGAAVNQQAVVEHGTGETASALMVAAALGSGDVGILLELLKHGATVDAQNSQGRTAFMFACRFRQLQCARTLLEELANPALMDNMGYTAIEWTKYGARERGANKSLRVRGDTRGSGRPLTFDTSDVVSKVQRLLAGPGQKLSTLRPLGTAQPRMSERQAILSVVEEEFIAAMKQAIDSRLGKAQWKGNTMQGAESGQPALPVASATTGAAAALLKRGHSVFEVVGKWMKVIGGEAARAQDVERVFQAQLQATHRASRVGSIRRTAVAAFSNFAAEAARHREQEEAAERQKKLEAEAKASSALQHRQSLAAEQEEELGEELDDVVPEPGEWDCDPRAPAGVRRVLPELWLGYDLDESQFRLKPSKSILALAAHPSAVVRRQAIRQIRMRAAEVEAGLEEAAVQDAMRRTGKSRASLRSRGQLQKKLVKRARHDLDAALSAQIAFGNFLTGYEGAVSARLLAEHGSGAGGDSAPVIVLRQNQLCDNCSKRAARLRDLNSHRKLCERCTLWLAKQDGHRHHRFKPIPPDGLSDGIMAQRASKASKEQEALSLIRNKLMGGITRVRNHVSLSKTLESAALLTPGDASTDTQSTAASTRPSTAASGRTGISAAAVSPTEVLQQRFSEGLSRDLQEARQSENGGDHPALSAVSRLRAAKVEASKDAKAATERSIVATAASLLLAADPEFTGALPSATAAADDGGSGDPGSATLAVIEELGRVRPQADSLEARQARQRFRPGSVGWQMTSRGLIGQAARERARRIATKAALLRQSQLGDIKALEKLKALISTSSAAGPGAKSDLPLHEKRRLAEAAMLTHYKSKVGSSTGTPPSAVLPIKSDMGKRESAPDGIEGGGAALPAGSLDSTTQTHPAALAVFRAFSPGQFLSGVDAQVPTEGPPTPHASSNAAEEERAALARTQKAERLHAKKAARLQRMAALLAAEHEASIRGGEALRETFEDDILRLSRLAQSLEAGLDGETVGSPEAKATVLRRAALLQGSAQQTLGLEAEREEKAEGFSATGRGALLHEASRQLQSLGLGVPLPGQEWGQEGASPSSARVAGSSTKRASFAESRSTLDNLVDVERAKQAMGNAVRNLEAEQALSKQAETERAEAEAADRESRRTLARLRVQSMYERPPELQMAACQMDRGDLQAAKRTLTGLMQRQKINLPRQHLGFAGTLVLLGRLHSLEQDAQLAQSVLREALELLRLHSVHPAHEDVRSAVTLLTESLSSAGLAYEANHKMEQYYQDLLSAFDAEESWKRRESVGAVSADDGHLLFNGRRTSEQERRHALAGTMKVLESTRVQRETLDMMREDAVYQKRRQRAEFRASCRHNRTSHLVCLGVSWRILQRWMYGQYTGDSLFQQMPELDPLISEDAFEPARQQGEQEALAALASAPEFFAVSARIDSDGASSSDEEGPGSSNHMLQFKLVPSTAELQQALAVKRWTRMLAQTARRQGIEDSVLFLADVLAYRSIDKRRINIGSNFDLERRVETVRVSAASRIIDQFVRQPQRIPIIPMNIRDGILESQDKVPFPISAFDSAFEIVQEQVFAGPWTTMWQGKLGARYRRERTLSVCLPQWSISMLAKLAAKPVDRFASTIQAVVRGWLARGEVQARLGERFQTLRQRSPRLHDAEEFVLRWMQKVGTPEEVLRRLEAGEIMYDSPHLQTPADGESATDHGLHVEDAEEETWQDSTVPSTGVETVDVHSSAAEAHASAAYGIDADGFPWSVDVDGYTCYTDASWVSFYRDDTGAAYMYRASGEMTYFDPVPPNEATAAEILSNLETAAHAGSAETNHPLHDYATASTLTAEGELLHGSAEPDTFVGSESPAATSRLADTPQADPPETAEGSAVFVPARAISSGAGGSRRRPRVYQNNSEAASAIQRIAKGFLARCKVRRLLKRRYVCEYVPESDTFEYVDQLSGERKGAPPGWLTVHYPPVRKGAHPLLSKSSSKAPTSEAAISARLQQEAALAQSSQDSSRPSFFTTETIWNAPDAVKAAARAEGRQVSHGEDATSHEAEEELWGDGVSWGVDGLGFPWQRCEDGTYAYTERQGLTFFRTEEGAAFYFDDEGVEVVCEEGEVKPPTHEQLREFFGPGNGTISAPLLDD